MTEYTNEYDRVDILGPGQTSERFLRVRGDGLTKICLGRDEYLVFADTLKYRMDDQYHPLDVREVKVLGHQEMASEDDTVSVVVEVKG